MSEEYREFLGQCQRSLKENELTFATETDIFAAHLFVHLRTVVNLCANNEEKTESEDPNVLFVELAAMRTLNLTYSRAGKELNVLIQGMINGLLGLVKENNGFLLANESLMNSIKKYNPRCYEWTTCVSEITPAQGKHFDSCVKEVVDDIIIVNAKLLKTPIRKADLFNPNRKDVAGICFFAPVAKVKKTEVAGSGHSNSAPGLANKQPY